MSGQPRLIFLALAGLLLHTSGVARADSEAWECRANADGTGWTCITEGERLPRAAGPPPPVSEAPQDDQRDPAYDGGAPSATDATAVPVTETAEPAAPPPAPPLPAPTRTTGIEEVQAPSAQPPEDGAPILADDGAAPEAEVPETRPAPAASSLAAPIPTTEIEEVQAPSVQPPVDEAPILADDLAAPEPEVPEPPASPAASSLAAPTPAPAIDKQHLSSQEEAGEMGVTQKPESIDDEAPVDSIISTETLAEPRSLRLDEGLTWETCGPLSIPLRAVSVEEEPDTHISADATEFFQENEVYVLSGGVELVRGQERAEADKARFDKKQGRLTAEGNVFFEHANLRFLGDKAELDLPSNQGWLKNVEYRLIRSNARGTAETAFVESPTLAHFENISYTTCRPGANDWQLSAGHLTLNNETGKGTARDARIRFWDIPIMYTPYMSFPLDDRRQTGFLTPSFGNSQTTGTDVSVPYYINIAPNMDATIKPRAMSKRGLMLGAEFRYLQENYSGEMAGEILPNDRDNGSETSDTRGQLSFQHRRRITPSWRTKVDAHWVSDDDYLQDFGDSLSVSSTRHVDQQAIITYSGHEFDFQGLVQHFNTIDDSIAPSDQPYNRLPQAQLMLGKPDQLFGATYHLRSEYAYFDHDHKEHGHRFSLRPGISLPLRRAYGHLIPKVSLDYTTYNLEGTQSNQSSNPSRTLPTASLDGGLAFERDIDWLGRAATQTLEPRLFYLYTPKDNQDDLPVFDTANLDLSFFNLFRENRFTGQDRIGDANQVTVALTSRTLGADTGQELFNASVGQIIHFRDRRVQLPGVSVQKNTTSVFIAEGSARLTSTLNARAGLTWDPHASGSQKREKTSAEVHYQTPDNRILNLAYRFNRGQESDEDNTRFEDVDASMLWPITPALKFVGRWNYSLFLDKTVEAFGGFEYGPCCWTLRALARHFIKERNGGSNTIYMVQLELTGLGKVGHKVEDFLERGIYGYRQE